jgi:hypothetical protein
MLAAMLLSQSDFANEQPGRQIELAQAFVRHMAAGDFEKPSNRLTGQ